MGQRRRNGQNKLKVKRHRDAIAANKKFTRKLAEKALANGADPTDQEFMYGGKPQSFTGHANYHVRYKAWRKAGMPLTGSAEEQAKFLASIHVKPPVVEPAAEPVV